MEGENRKFDTFSNIYSRFSEENKLNIFKTAEDLLKLQRRDIDIIKREATGGNFDEFEPLETAFFGEGDGELEDR